MFKKSLVLNLVLPATLGLLLSVPVVAFRAQEKAKTDAADTQAKEVADQFMKGIMGQDIQAVMRTVEVPFFLTGKHILNDRDQLKDKLEGLATGADQIDDKFRGTYRFGSLPEGFCKARDFKALTTILKKTDPVFAYEVPRRLINLAVATREGKPKVVALLPTGLLSLAVIRQEKGNHDKTTLQAMKAVKDVVEEFLKAANSRDLDGLLKAADLPWYSDGTNIIKTQAALQKELKSDWVDDRQFPSQMLGMTKVEDFSQLLGKQRLRPEEVLTKDDWVVILGRDGEAGYLFVRVTDGKAKIVGYAS